MVVWSRGVSNFSGGVSPIFRGGVSPIFRGGCLQFFGGGVSPIFRGGGWFSNFSGGVSKFFFLFFSILFPPKNSSGMHQPPETVNARPVRILLECILVLFCIDNHKYMTKRLLHNEFGYYDRTVIVSNFVFFEMSMYGPRPRLHRASASTLRPLCDDASNWVLIEINGNA